MTYRGAALCRYGPAPLYSDTVISQRCYVGDGPHGAAVTELGCVSRREVGGVSDVNDMTESPPAAGRCHVTVGGVSGRHRDLAGDGTGGGGEAGAGAELGYDGAGAEAGTQVSEWFLGVNHNFTEKKITNGLTIRRQT